MNDWLLLRSATFTGRKTSFSLTGGWHKGCNFLSSNGIIIYHRIYRTCLMSGTCPAPVRHLSGTCPGDVITKTPPKQNWNPARTMYPYWHESNCCLITAGYNPNDRLLNGTPTNLTTSLISTSNHSSVIAFCNARGIFSSHTDPQRKIPGFDVMIIDLSKFNTNFKSRSKHPVRGY